MARIVGITRERRCSPGKVDDDAAILEATLDVLRGAGHSVARFDPDRTLVVELEPDLVLAMCEEADALARLDSWSANAPVLNRPEAIRRCRRTSLLPALTAAAVAQPRWADADASMAEAESFPVWLKRGDTHAISAGDVRRVESRGELRAGLAALRSRGVDRAIVQAHVEGPVFKFYGVGGGFFRAFGLAPEHEAAAAALATRAAHALGLDVYGGDGVVDRDGQLLVIDVNAWPSFSRCRAEGAQAIAAHALAILEEALA